jgi:hypothetical protein
MSVRHVIDEGPKGGTIAGCRADVECGLPRLGAQPTMGREGLGLHVLHRQHVRTSVRATASALGRAGRRIGIDPPSAAGRIPMTPFIMAPFLFRNR